MPKTVKAVTTELHYMKATAEKYLEKLPEKGIKEAAIAAFDQCEANVVSIDKERENAKKVSNVSRKDRDRIRHEHVSEAIQPARHRLGGYRSLDRNLWIG